MSVEKSSSVVFDDNILRQRILMIASVLAISYGIWFGIENLQSANYVLAAIDFLMFLSHQSVEH